MQQPVKLGALSLLLAITVLCLATLSVLTLSTAATDIKMAQRQAENMQQQYNVETLAQQWLAQVDTALQEGGTLPPGTREEGASLLCAEIVGSDGRQISVALDTAKGAPFTIVRWQLKSGIVMDGTLQNLYTG